MKAFGQGYARPSILTVPSSKPCRVVSEARRGRVPSFLCQKTRSASFGFDPNKLQNPDMMGRYSPRLVSDNFGGNVKEYYQRISSPELQSTLGRNGSQLWYNECQHRLSGTGFINDVKIQEILSGARNSDGTVANLNDRCWRSLLSLRLMAQFTLEGGSPVEAAIAARKLCAETKDPRFAPIYHTLDTQAHALYVLGRVELERDPLYRPLAWYMLMISAGLGQLDAALLLHQLHKVDSTNFVDVEQRDVIARAAEQRLDWRAMVAHSEHMIAQLKQRRRGERLQPSELEPYLEMLSEASEMTDPTETAPPDFTVPAGCLNVPKLEFFAPPYKMTLALTAEECLNIKAPEQLDRHFRAAAERGVEEYHDPEAAWLYSQWQTARGDQFSQDWERYTEVAAGAGNSDACFQLAKLVLNRDAWYPSLAARVLDDIQKHELEDVKRHRNAVDFKVTTEDEKHQEIMDRCDPKLLQKDEGLFWMRTSAELQLDNPNKMVNRYCVVAGLLRQNGFLREGRAVLEEAQKNLRLSTGNPGPRATALRRVAEYLQDWDQRKVHRLLTNDQLGQLLGPPIGLSSKTWGAE